MPNPLDVNCQAFKLDSNSRVIGVELGITKVENAKYELYRVRLRDEIESGGQTIAACSVLDTNGINTGQQVRMAWPGKGPIFDASGLPGNPNSVHIVTNGYAPPKLGPLAFHVGGFNASISDILYGVGLPNNRHVSFDIVFIEKGTIIKPDDDLITEMKKFKAWAIATSAYWKGSPQYV